MKCIAVTEKPNRPIENEANMKKMGPLIKSIRTSQGISRESLAKGIYSSKYIYLIEKGLRTPSSEILIDVGIRLNFDLFEYFPYMDCENPLVVKAFIDEFHLLRAKKDLDKLEEMTDEARKNRAFQNVPWKSQIDYNQAYIRLFRGNLSLETHALIQQGILNAGGTLNIELQAKSVPSADLLRFYNLLGEYYLLSGDH